MNKNNIPTNDLFLEKLQETKKKLIKIKNKTYVTPKVNELPEIDKSVYNIGSKVHLTLDDNIYEVDSNYEWQLYVFKNKVDSSTEVFIDSKIEEAKQEISTDIDNAKKQVKAEILGSSSEELDTLKELADALGNNPNFATTVLNQLANKAEKSDVEDIKNSLKNIDSLLDNINGEVV